MRVLIVGSGGREHALAWKLAQSPLLEKLFTVPGNAGTAQLGENLEANLERGHSELVRLCREKRIDLAVIGPEAPLAAGLADALRVEGIPVFGPSRAAAQIEASKVFAKEFMGRHNIPTARYAAFSQYEPAAEYLGLVGFPVVIKASGLAGGKGVLLPESKAEALSNLRALLQEDAFGEAGTQVVIEERLEGEEISLLAFTDGKTVRLMPPAQDHKRLLDGDRGPNTGGMGAYAPAPACPQALSEALLRSVLQPAVAGLRAEGRPFAGVLYAGLMLATDGPRVLEFNCRFGDPETQAILPLLESDLLEILSACASGRLEAVDIRWKAGAAACVVLAAEGYPGKVESGRAVCGLDCAAEQAIIFHAGTRREGDQVVSAGGRVLGVTGVGADLPAALSAAYAAIRQINFTGMQYRHDIGHRALSAGIASAAYARSGVDISAGNRAVDLMRKAVQSTYGSQVLAGIGAFGGLYAASMLKEMDDPVLVASTDGVGTKVKLATQAGRYASIGVDLVNHCTNDILAQGARPLFFLDYFAAAKLDPEMVAEVVSGAAAACREAGCALLGGETAEMPGVYSAGEFDLAGTIVGVVERSQALPRADIRTGDLVVGLRSSGAHTNGYSLIRQVFSGIPLDARFAELEASLGEALLAPHRSYLPLLGPILAGQPGVIKALAHITGGGLVENLPRVLPAGIGARLHPSSWPVPGLFALIQRRGRVTMEEMHRVFNMGIGMAAVVSPEDLPAFQGALGEESWVIGELVAGERKVVLG